MQSGHVAMLELGEQTSERKTRRAPLILGFGNVLLRDDGVGVHLSERLGASLGADAGIFLDAGTMSFSLLPYIEATDALVVIDAANLQGEPGQTALFEGPEMDRFLQSARKRTVHEIGIIDLMDMARLQGCLPDRRALLCIQPDRIDWGDALSPSVATALPGAERLVMDLLQRWASA